MTDEKRWMVRKTGNKHPRSAYESKPLEYEPPAGEDDFTPTEWSMRWNVPCVQAEYAEAKSYIDRHAPKFDGLTFVIHHGYDLRPKRRIVCLDFDKCINEAGELDPTVADILVMFEDTFIELSRGLHGLHVFLNVEDCPAFANLLKRKIGGCKVDVLCSNPVAVTGNVYGEFHELKTITFRELEGLPFFTYKQPSNLSTVVPEWWSDDPVDDIPEEYQYLISDMEAFEAIEGQGGSQVLFKAGCNLLRSGVTGRMAEALLRLVPATPPFSAKQIQRTLECAYRDVIDKDEFETDAFPMLEDLSELSQEERDKRNYGFKFYTYTELAELNTEIEWLAEGAFTTEGALLIGGREKCFKTGVAADLLVSLATGTNFLDRFPVPKIRSSVIFTAEIGINRAKFLLESIRIQKGLSVRDIHDKVKISEFVPSFALNRDGKPVDPKILEGLKRFFHDHKPEVAVFDPLYFAMGGASVGDMYAIGAVLKNITDLCRNAGVQPVFCHHAKKDAEKEFKPMYLQDFYGAGIGAFARQWLLLAHSDHFSKGVAKLFANIGGSSQGDRGIWDLTIDEGQPDDIMDRQWRVEMEKRAESDSNGISDGAVTECLARNGKPMSAKEVSIFLDGHENLAKRILDNLLKAGQVVMNGKKYVLPPESFLHD